MRFGWKKTSLTTLCVATLASSLYSNVLVDAAPSHWTHKDGRYHPILDVLNERKLYKRDIADIWEVCPLDSSTTAGAMFLHFTAIFFQDFTTGGGTDILGPLAVGGKFTAPNYIVNANRGQDCSVPPTTGLEGIGLVVGGLTDTEDTRVHGDSVHAGGGDLNEIKGLDEGEGCATFDDIGTGVVDFEVAENVAIDASVVLANIDPNHYMDSDGRITDLGNSGSTSYKVFTFNTCNNGDCAVGGVLSDPNAIFFGNGNFNGPSGDVPSDEDTVVFNIPVTVGTTIELKTNFPSQGFYACRTIYNFYPVNDQGIYSTTGEFTLFRNTGGQIEGFTLAPRGHILDSATGAFAGTLIALDYGWYYGTYGVELHDYGAADDNCNDFVGCFPIDDSEESHYSTITTVETLEPTVVTVTSTHLEITEIPTVYQTANTLPIDATLPDLEETISTIVTVETIGTEVHVSTILTTVTLSVDVPIPPETTTITTEISGVPTTIISTITETEVGIPSVINTIDTETEYEIATITTQVTVVLTTTTSTKTSMYTTVDSTVVTITPRPTTITTFSPLPTTWTPPTTRSTGSITTTPRPTITTTIYETTEVLYPYIEKKKKWDKWDKYDEEDSWRDNNKKGKWKNSKKYKWDDEKDDDDWKYDSDWDEDEKWNDDKKWKKKGDKKYD